MLSTFVDKVTTGTYSFVSVILNIGFLEAFIAGLAGLSSCVVKSVKTQFSDQVKFKDTSQLIKDMSRLLQKLFKYFNGTTISRFL